MTASVTPALSRAPLLAVMPPELRHGEPVVSAFVVSVFVPLPPHTPLSPTRGQSERIPAAARS